ncbi:glycosyltransferase family 2 protein [Pseudarthrobacter sp. P1]|uniref:glycosyltransferase family 2 protein n=1 Tax=Pseudarthrobacter sp. P1 TaxID=3418418 RepID=UPI003CF0BE6C
MILFYIVLVLGLSTVFWTVAGLMRLATEQCVRAVAAVRQFKVHHAGTLNPFRSVGDYLDVPLAEKPFLTPEEMARHRSRGMRIKPWSVAVLIAAHNEAMVITETIRTVAVLVPLHNIHVIDDKSTDETASIARAAGVRVLELERNKGKAGALAAGIEYFELCRRFKVVMVLDADTRPTPDYLTTGLPLFDDPSVVAVAGRAKSIMDPPAPTWLGRFLVNYRERLYIVVQLLLKYGQAARGANVVSIVPGFASMYRTTALEKINILALGLVIEDFNMTFEVHAQKLGRIAFHPGAAVAYTQDPDTFADYIRQVRRWQLGFWQTVRRHKGQLSRFWLVLGIYIVELVASSLFFVLLIPAFLLSLVAAAAVAAGDHNTGLAIVAGFLRPQDVLIGVFLPDLLLTLLAVFSLRKPSLLLMAPLFPFMRIVDAAICLRALPAAFSATSSGAWTSPTRRVQRSTV